MPSPPFTGLWRSDVANTPRDPTQSSGSFFSQPLADNANPKSPARVGVLSRTLVRSSTVQWIIPARIRHKDKNDTLFIGGDYVQIRQLSMHNQFHDVATKADFGSPIRAARVFGSERKPAASVLEQIVKQETEEGIESMEVDGALSQVLPPQILALTLESQKLVFLFATDGPLNQINFMCCTRELPYIPATRHLYGKHLAVDPRSRAMAISAQADYCGVYALKPMHQLQEEMSEFGSLDEGKFKPISEEHYFQVDGIILKMEFLSLIEGEEDTVNLLLIVSRNQHSYAQLYQWDITTRLRNLTSHAPHRLHPKEQIPLLLVPLTKNASFMMISDTTISIWNDLAFGAPRTSRDPLSVLEYEPVDFGNSRRQPLITQWARPVRRQGYVAEHDDVYISREDGVVQLVEIKPLITNGSPVNIVYHVGPLDGSIDTAFAVLDTGRPGGDDLIVACGDMSDVGLYTIKARKPPIRQQALPNWAPVLDFVAIEGSERAVPKNSKITYGTRTRPSRNRIFAISGRGDENGSVNELRHGLEARVALNAEQEENSSIVQLWAFPDAQGSVLYLLASYPWRSTLMHISADGTDLDYGYDEDTTGLDLNSHTLAAGNTADGVIIQLTETSIRATILLEEGRRFVGDSLPDGAKVIVAAVREESSLFATVVRKGTEQTLYCGRMILESDRIRCELTTPLTLTTPPTCLCIEMLGSTPCIVIGFNTAIIQVVSILDTGLDLTLNQPISLAVTNTDNPACATLAILSLSSEDQKRSTLLCGLRSGNLVHFDILIDGDLDGQNIELRQTGFFKLGETTVRVSSDNCDRGAAFVTCGKDFWKLTYASDPASKQYVLESIYVTDQNEPYLQQGPINAHVRVGMFPYLGLGGLGGSLVCIQGQHMVISSLETTAKVVPRRLKINGTPNRIVHVPHLNKLVVAVTCADLRVTKDRRHGGIIGKKRWLCPTLRVVDPDQPLIKEQQSIESEDDSSKSPKLSKMHIPIGKAGERILALLAWNPSDGSKTYQFIIAGTRIQRRDNLPCGRLLTFSIRQSSGQDNQMVIKTRHQTRFEHPVYSVAAWGTDAVVLCTGKTLIMQRVDLEEGRWHRVATFELRSPGLALSILEPLVSVNTATDSIFMFRFENNEFHPCGADELARHGQHLINLNDSTTLAANKTCSVVGFQPPPVTSTRTTARTLFEALLHTSVTRLGHALIRPTWMLDRRVILGSTADGTVYQFTLLNRSEQQLLRFVQNLAQRDRLICPFRRHTAPLHHVDPTDQTEPVQMHVDGDVLSRVVDSGIRHFQTMISQRPVQIDNQHDFEDGEARKARFCELAAEVVGDVDDDEKAEAVMEWMRNHLQLVL